MGTTNSAKIIAFDIETTNLNSNFGYILCAAWKVLGTNKIHHVTITESPTFADDPTNDEYVVTKLADAISSADVWITWYGSKFDVPYVQSRLLYHEREVMPRVPHVDGWRIAKYQMRLNSNRLASVTAFLGLEDKTPLSGPIWIRAMAGHRPSIKYVLEHCKQDVSVLEQVYERIKPLCSNHPNVNLVARHRIGAGGACPTCGSDHIHSRGMKIFQTRARQQYQCQECKSWSYGPALKASVTIRP